MKITKNQLKKIIKEEILSALNDDDNISEGYPLDDESPLEKAKDDQFRSIHDQATAAAQNFEELASQDETQQMYDIQRKYIDLFKSGGNEFGDLGALAVIAIANAYSLVNR
tara:strand:- start:969 stop:1301 length:333 start_codon:yes stop_codon:yes gene_type:complete